MKLDTDTPGVLEPEGVSGPLQSSLTQAEVGDHQLVECQ